MFGQSDDVCELSLKPVIGTSTYLTFDLVSGRSINYACTFMYGLGYSFVGELHGFVS